MNAVERAADLLELIPDDDDDYLAAYKRCLESGWHPAVAAVQADMDVRQAAACQRRDEGRRSA